MKTTYTLAAIAAIALASCENPADKTTAAAVSDSVTKVAETADGTRYTFTSNSTIGFTGSKVTGKHDGGFKTFTGHFTIKDGAPVGNDHRVEIDMTSTWSDAEKLTEHLKADDFFNVAQFPKATFDVTSLTKGENNSWTVAGNFNLHGVEKNISFPATVVEEGDTVKITAEFNINRQDFGIKYAGKTDDLIRDEVIIRLNLEAKPEA